MTPADLATVQHILGDRYAIERELGRGGMGTVYLARDLRLDRQVALKVLPSTFARDARLRERFLRETRTSASFSHPNIVPVFAIEESADLVAYAMGYVEGESLDSRVRRAGPLSTRELVRLLQDIGYALAYAHGRGVVHRDIKPDNVMIERATGRALLMDFGVARPIAAVVPVAQAGLTRVGEVVGTPEYMSPEQACGEAMDGRSDLYSLGLVAFFASTGRTVMSDLTPQRIMIRQLTEAVPSLAVERRDLPTSLTRAIDRCVAKDPAERFQTAEALVEAIDETQLAATEIPIPIRGFAQELSTLLLLVVVLLAFCWFIVRNAPKDLTAIDRWLPTVFFFGVAMTRTLQSMSVVRRLTEAGFSITDITRGLRAIADEGATLREQIKRSPESRTRWRWTIAVGLGILPVAALCFYGSYLLRVPPVTAIAAGGRTVTEFQSPTVLGTGLVILGQLIIAFSFVLLTRSPFRMSIGELAYRAVWLGPIGRAFVRVGAGMTRRTPLSAEGARMAPPETPLRSTTAAPPNSASIAQLDERVKALEQMLREKR